MKTKKRTKNSRIRGARTCGWGFRQKHKGHGNKGGVGMAGSGKRADQKKQSSLIKANASKLKKYFGKKGFTSISQAKDKSEVINLRDVEKKFPGQKRIELRKHKILGVGEGFKAEIVAKTATQSAIDKMTKAGGKITLPEKKEDKKKVVEDKEE